MSDNSAVPNTGVNTGVASPSTPNPVSTGTTTPVGANPAQQDTDNRVPYSRFKEVIDERNSMTSELQELRELRARLEGGARPTSVYDQAANNLVAKGLDPEAAKAFVESQRMIAEAVVLPVEKKSADQEVQGWLSDFQKSHEDYEQLAPAMYEVFNRLPEPLQEAIASTKDGLDLLYSRAIALNRDLMKSESYKKGVQDAYDNRQLKSAISSASAGSAAPDFLPSRAEIANMTVEEYKAKRDLIMANLHNLR